MTVKEWLILWFVGNTEALEIEIRSNVSQSYFAWIDSLKFINLICDIEEKFQIKFSNDEFQDRSFSTINGLAEITERKAFK